MSLFQNSDLKEAGLNSIITDVNQKIADLENRKSIRAEKIKQSQQLNITATQASIKSDIDFLCDSIMKMSSICLAKINVISQNCSDLNENVDEICGTLGMVKDTKGSSFLDEYAAEINKDNIITEKLQKREALKPPPPYVLTPTNGKEISSHNTCCPIDIHAYDNVGKKIEEQTKADLIIPIYPNEERIEI